LPENSPAPNLADMAAFDRIQTGDISAGFLLTQTAADMMWRHLVSDKAITSMQSVAPWKI
jgi:hypothetical protein